MRTKPLLTYEEALETILGTPIRDRGIVLVPLAESLGRILAEPIYASAPSPRFSNSSVDGYAIGCVEDSRAGKSLVVSGVIAAGQRLSDDIPPGHAYRIFTGAPTPQNTFAVVMQEDVERIGDGLVLKEAIAHGKNIRVRASEFDQEETLLEAGTIINPGVIALASSQGLTDLFVHSRPKVFVLSTGDELVFLPNEPAEGQLFDSNGPMLSAIVSLLGGQPTLVHCPDDEDKLESTLRAAAAEHDLILVSGGASVGERDFLAATVERLGIVDFHGIRVRPGKPLLFGRISEIPVLGFPGNPASTYVTFHLFGRPLLLHLMGVKKVLPVWASGRVGWHHESEARDVFARVNLTDSIANEAFVQDSFGIRSLAGADALLHLEAGREYQPGDEARVTSLRI